MKDLRLKNDILKKGISLITLMITIVIIIILAGVIILAVNKNNPIKNANEAVYRSDISQIQSQLNLFAANEYIKNKNFDVSKMNGKVSDYIPTLIKYDSELQVFGGKLRYIGDDIVKKEILQDMNVETDIVTINSLSYNKPNISYLPESTTKAIKWDTSNNESKISLTNAKTDTSWYDYASKKWANIETTNNSNDAYWVWIPRYAYKITYYTDSDKTTVSLVKTNYGKIDVIFLAGITNNPADGTALPSDYIVHPAFTFGNKELTGIWVAKYEASSNTPNVVESGVGYTGGGNTTALQVNVLPNVYSWRNISIGNVQTVSMNMTSSTGSVGTNKNVDTHQMKNIEWGAASYLCQSEYGQEPWINPYGDWTNGSYKLKTGYSGESKDSGALLEGSSMLHPYNDLTFGVKASTTGNIYGIYDMSGGAYERTAALINNGNSNIGTYAGIYAENNKIKAEYSKYYDIYEPGDEEKEGSTFYGEGVQNLCNSVSPYNVNEVDNNVIRKKLTDSTYANFANHKGDALYETSTSTSYYGKYTSGTSGFAWLKDTTRSSGDGYQLTMGWNEDHMLTGYADRPWNSRGSSFSDGPYAGVDSYFAGNGQPYMGHSFRPVLVVGLTH